MSAAHDIVRVMQSQAYDSLKLARIKLMDEFKAGHRETPSFWYKTQCWGSVETKSIVMTHKHPMFERVKSWDDSANTLQDHKSRMSVALSRIFSLPKSSGDAGMVPSYLEQAVNRLGLSADSFPNQEQWTAWELRFKHEVGLMRFYSLSTAMM